jgi:hypothetical protein
MPERGDPAEKEEKKSFKPKESKTVAHTAQSLLHRAYPKNKTGLTYRIRVKPKNG